MGGGRLEGGVVGLSRSRISLYPYNVDSYSEGYSCFASVPINLIKCDQIRHGCMLSSIPWASTKFRKSDFYLSRD